MKKYMRIGVSALASLALASVLCVLPSHAQNNNAATSAQTAAATRSVSGKVTSIGKSSFTLTLASEKISISAQPQTMAKSMTFQVDNNTTIEGRLQVGVNADVTYREEAGNNIAISVRVTP
jgi:Cu/Ag efflux protein CusF